MALSQFDRLAGPLAKVIQLGPSGLAASDRLDVDNIGRMNRKDSLHTLIAYNSPDGEHLIDAPAFAGNDRAGEHLNPLFVAFFDLAAHVYDIAYLEIGDVLL